MLPECNKTRTFFAFTQGFLELKIFEGVRAKKGVTVYYFSDFKGSKVLFSVIFSS